MQLPRTLLFKEWATEKESGNKKEKEQRKRKEDTGKTNVLKSIKGKRRGGGRWETTVHFFLEESAGRLMALACRSSLLTQGKSASRRRTSGRALDQMGDGPVEVGGTWMSPQRIWR